MAIMENNYEQEMVRLWTVITDLSEALNQHRQVAASLHAQAGGIKAIHSQTGFVLRRFNLDKPKEEYDAELERMTASLTLENQALQHDNKQLNALIKEYEQTLETLMTTFRNRAHEVQEHELNLIREYESALVAKETEVMAEELNANMAFSASLSRLGQNLRKTMRALNGEESPEGEDDGDLAGVIAADWALERESELARLERENAELRRMLGVTVDSDADSSPNQRFQGSEATRTFPSLSRNSPRGGAAGTVGPLGTFKRRVPG